MAQAPRLPKPKTRNTEQPGPGPAGTGAGRDTPGAGNERGQFESDRQRERGTGKDRPPVYTPPTDYRGGYSDRSIPVAKKSMAPGGGGRFEAFVSRLVSEGKSASSAKAIAASAGRKKYGAAKMAKFSAEGRKRAQ